MSNWRDIVFNGCIIAGVIGVSVIIYFYSKDKCPVGTMSCSSAAICIPQKNVCNFYNDCPDGEDEDEILCNDLHGSTHLLDDILNTSLTETLSITKSASLCDIEEYPKICVCGFRTRIYCNNADLTNIPQTISKTVTYLGLRNNSIAFLEMDSLKRYNLTLLYLEDNNLIYITPNVFQHQNYLKRLFLMNNNITLLKPGVFNGLINLEWLLLDKNYLKEINLDVFVTLTEIKWLDLSYNNLTFEVNESFPYLPMLLELYLNNNKIMQIGKSLFYKLEPLRVLNLRSNQIKFINSESFKNLNHLEELDLFDNSIGNISPSLFVNQHHLTKLSLGKNPIKYLNRHLFVNLRNLLSLNLEEIELKNIDTNLFIDLVKLKAIYLKSYKYCAYAPTVPRCSPPSDGVSSVNQLLFKPIFRYSNWIMCFITIAGNILVLFGRFLFKDENKNLSIVIKHLAVSDGLMGIYLLIIAHQDLQFRDNYNTSARKWISSWSCVMTGILCMTSLEVSIMVLVFMSIDRYFVITMPYRNYGALNCKETWRILIFIWCFGISLSIMPVLAFISSTKFYGVNGLCLPLYINDPYLVGWQYSALIFFGINAASLVIIIYAYGGMFVNIKKTRNATSMPMDDCQFAVKFFCIVVTNIACWLPIIVAKVIVYFEIEVSADVYGWLTVFVLPINSSLNPILYTFTTRKYREKLLELPSCIKNLVNSSATHQQYQTTEGVFSIKTKDSND